MFPSIVPKINSPEATTTTIRTQTIYFSQYILISSIVGGMIIGTAFCYYIHRILRKKTTNQVSPNTINSSKNHGSKTDMIPTWHNTFDGLNKQEFVKNSDQTSVAIVYGNAPKTKTENGILISNTIGNDTTESRQEDSLLVSTTAMMGTTLTEENSMVLSIPGHLQISQSEYRNGKKIGHGIKIQYVLLIIK